MSLCQYKDLFGKPEQGFHAQRIFGFALYDTLGTIVISLIIAKLFGIRWYTVLLGVFILGQVLHFVFCVNTTFMNQVGLNF